jgi:diphthamide biosynthesis protein 4
MTSCVVLSADRAASRTDKQEGGECCKQYLRAAKGTPMRHTAILKWFWPRPLAGLEREKESSHICHMTAYSRVSCPDHPPRFSMMRPDYYRILELHVGASYIEVKRAYQTALLAAHPDKRRGTDADGRLTVDLVREAFAVLSDPATRADYDRQRAASGSAHSPRPAHVLSLDDWVEERDRWTYACRCGGTFAITEAEMEAGTHLSGCGSCSEVVWVGYELG